MKKTVLLILGLVVIMIIPLKKDAREINTTTKHKIFCAGESVISFEAFTGVINIEEVVLLVGSQTSKHARGAIIKTRNVSVVGSKIYPKRHLTFATGGASQRNWLITTALSQRA